MNKLEELKINVQALQHAVSDDKKFFVSIFQFVNEFHKMLNSSSSELSKEKILFLAQKIEDFFDKYRPTGDGFYMSPVETDRSDDTVKSIYSLAQNISSLSDSDFKSLAPIAKPKISKPTKAVFDSNKVFIVHGHDGETKIEVARFIEKLGLEAIILHEKASSGKTIIEKIESYSDVGFAVVLYTPDDLGTVKTDKENLKPRARQNVVFEHGFLIGKLGRDKVSAVVKGSLELPNDISGVVYISEDNWQLDLAKEMKESGCSIDFNKLF